MVWRMPPIHRLVESGKARATSAAGEAARQRRGKADAFHDRRIGRLVEADIDDERRGQDAGKGIAELVQHDEQQDQDRGVAGEKLPERTEGGQQNAADRIAGLVDDVGGRGRLGRHQRRENADADQHRGGEIAPQPDRPARHADLLQPPGQREHAGARRQHADAVGRDIARHAGGLFAGVEAFDPERVDHDVLGRRGGRHQHCAERDRPQRRGSDPGRPGTGSPRRAAIARTPASRAAGRARATGSGYRAHRPAAPTGISACRAGRPARRARWCAG